MPCRASLFVFSLWTAFVASSLAPYALPAIAADWPRFRGPNGSGVNPTASLPTKLDPDENLLWRVSIPAGNSSPIVRDGRVFVTAEEGDERAVICLDALSGKRLWKRSFVSLREQPTHERVGQTAPTPAADAEGVYAFFTDIGLLALDADGRERWRVPLGLFHSIYGISSSPLVTPGAVVLVVDQTEGSFIAAFSKDDGEMLWRSDRPDGSGGYATPVLIGAEAQQILVSGSSEIAVYSTETGNRLWGLDGLPGSSFTSPVAGDGWAYIGMASAPGQSPPFATIDKNGDGLIGGEELDDFPFPGVLLSWAVSLGNRDGLLTPAEYRTAGELLRSGRSTLFAIRLPDRDADGHEEMIRWKRFKELPLVTSPLVYERVLYLVKSGGILSAFDSETGAVLKQGRLRNAIDDYSASPVAADGRILFASETGKLTVVRAGKDWEELSTHALGEMIYASPAVAGDRVYVRTEKGLWCFGIDEPRR